MSAETSQSLPPILEMMFFTLSNEPSVPEVWRMPGYLIDSYPSYLLGQLIARGAGYTAKFLLEVRGDYPALRARCIAEWDAVRNLQPRDFKLYFGTNSENMAGGLWWSGFEACEMLPIAMPQAQAHTGRKAQVAK